MTNSDAGMQKKSNNIDKELYAKIAELDEANEILFIHRALYDISLFSLEPEVLAKKIVDTMRHKLHLEIAGIFLFDKEKDIFNPLHFAKSERLLAVLHKAGFFLRDVPITMAHTRSAFKNIFNGAPFITKNISDIWGGLIKSEDIDTLSKATNIKTIIIYPLMTEEHLIGSILLGYTYPYEQFSLIEKDSLKSFANVISVALDKSYLYKNLTTANKRLIEINKEMSVANEKLKTIDAAKSNLLSFASHYLQNPITNIVMGTMMLADGSFGIIDKETKKATLKIQESAKHLSITVNTWQKALDLEEGRAKYTMSKFDLVEMIKKVMESWNMIALERYIAMSFEFDKKLSYMINADPIWINEVIVNLIDNSFKMTENGFVKLKLEKIDQGDIKIFRFSISDSGIGVDEPTLSTLFQKFERGVEGWHNNVSGAGLGLYISKKIVEEGHNGRIWVESDGHDKGATFYIELPE